MYKITLTAPLIQWLANGERGISSNTMFTVITGVNALRDDGYRSHPHDLGDFRRCRQLAEASQDIKNNLDRMKSVSRQWSAIVDNWDEICRLMDEERPNWRTNKNRELAPKTSSFFYSVLEGYMSPADDFANKANSFLATNDFKRAISDPAIPYDESIQPEPESAMRDFLAGVLCALAVGLPLTCVYLWRTGGL